MNEINQMRISRRKATVHTEKLELPNEDFEKTSVQSVLHLIASILFGYVMLMGTIITFDY